MAHDSTKPLAYDLLPKRFLLNRNTDVSGVSGTGYVAAGTQYSDGHCTLRWFAKQDDPDGELCSTNIYSSIENLARIHGHDGSTTIEWID